MPNFRYKGIDPQGARVEGEISAASIDDAERRVSSQDVMVVSIVPVSLKVRRSSEGGVKQALSRRVGDAEIATILRDLSVMAETGVPFVEALDAVLCTTGSAVAKAGLQALRSEVVAGRSLASGMKAAHGLFPPMVCELVRVAEEGGRLDRALASAATYLERAADLRRKVFNAMLYPAVLVVIAIGAVAVLVGFVLPKFSKIFDSMNAEVPATTKFVLAAGEFARAHPWGLLSALAAFVVFARLAWTHPKLRRASSRWMLRLPVIGDLTKKLALARAFQSIATLLSCNVSLMSALDHGAKVSGNPLVEDALQEVRHGVEHGGALSECMAASGSFTPMLVQMVAIGERTGRLASLMANTALHLEEEVDSKIKALVSVVEPVMISVMGLVVGVITVSIIAPIYSVVQNIK